VDAGRRARHPRSAARRQEAPGRQGSDANGSDRADSASECRSPVPNPRLHSPPSPRQVLSLSTRPPLLIHAYCIPATTQLLVSWTSHHHQWCTHARCDLLIFGACLTASLFNLHSSSFYTVLCLRESESVCTCGALCLCLSLSTVSVLHVNDYFLNLKSTPFALHIVYYPVHIRMRALSELVSELASGVT
jgi:hypothetical protein